MYFSVSDTVYWHLRLTQEKKQYIVNSNPPFNSFITIYNLMNLQAGKINMIELYSYTELIQTRKLAL